MKNHKKQQEDYFPNLRLKILKLYANRWVKKYSIVPIERIILYRYSPLDPELTQGVPTKYAVEFEIPGEQEMLRRAMEICSLDAGDFSLCELNKLMSVASKVYNKLESSTEYYQTVPEKYPYSALIDSGFSDVYKQLPEDDFRKEWIFFPRKIDDDLKRKTGAQPLITIGREEPYWILFQRKSSTIVERKIHEIIKKSRPEIELLYDQVKKVGFSGHSTSAAEKEWQGAALKYFDEHEDDFSFIKKEYLADRSIYRFVGGQEKRDFVGKILQKICKDHDLGKISSRWLYEHYTSIDQPTNSPTN